MYYMCPGGGKRFVAAGSRPRNIMCVHALCALLRPLLGQAPNPESGLTVVFRARCGLTSSRAYVLSGGCYARARGRSTLLRPSVGSLGGHPPQTPVSCLTVVFRARCGLTSSRAYVLGGGCSAWAGGRSTLIRRSVGSLGGHPPQTPGSCLTVVFRARCGLTSSRAYVLSGGCCAGVLGRFCVGLSPRPAALRSAAFALNARPLACCRPRPLFRLSVVLVNVYYGCSARAVGRFCVYRSFVFFMVIRVM